MHCWLKMCEKYFLLSLKKIEYTELVVLYKLFPFCAVHTGCFPTSIDIVPVIMVNN